MRSETSPRYDGQGYYCGSMPVSDYGGNLFRSIQDFFTMRARKGLQDVDKGQGSEDYISAFQ